MKYAVTAGLICLFTISLFSFSALAQNPSCATFTTGSDGWTATNATATFPSGVASLVDGPTGSTFNAPPAWNGNWLQYSGGCGSLCFRVNVTDDGASGTNPSVSPYFIVKDGPGNSGIFRATPFAEGSGWHQFCAPVQGMTGNALPSSPQGTWEYRNASNVVVTPTPAQWTALLQNVVSFRFAIDITGGTERMMFDDICFRQQSCPKADFNIGPTCVGGAVPLTDTSVGATSWSWTFGSNATPPTSTAQSPLVIFNVPGTYPVKLCINGGTTLPLCITKNVTISAQPAQPIISGPKTACGKTATYCVSNPQSGVTYTWNITGATPATATGTCVTVTWTAATGVISVTGTLPIKGCAARNVLDVGKCNPPDPCCPDPFFQVPNATLQKLTATTWQLRPVIGSSQPIGRVTLDVLSVTQLFQLGVCGAPRPLPATITNVSPVLGLTPNLTVFNGSEAVWSGSTGPFGPTLFPVDLTLPAVSAKCPDVIRICVKVTVTTKECRSCQRVVCFDFKRGGPIDGPIDPDQPPVLD